MKKMTISMVFIFIVLIISITIGYVLGFGHGDNSTLNKSSKFSPKIPVSSNPLVAPNTIIRFNFDMGIPSLLEGKNTPFTQTSDDVTALFCSDSDPASFSIQSYKTTFYTLTEFTDKYLFDNKITRDNLFIAFSQPITEISFTFASAEFEGPNHIEKPSTLKLMAYKDSTNSQPIDSAYAKGNFSNSFYPQGKMSYNSNGKPFNIVKIELVYQINGGTDFLIDDIIVKTI